MVNHILSLNQTWYMYVDSGFHLPLEITVSKSESINTSQIVVCSCYFIVTSTSLMFFFLMGTTINNHYNLTFEQSKHSLLEWWIPLISLFLRISEASPSPWLWWINTIIPRDIVYPYLLMPLIKYVSESRARVCDFDLFK